MGVVCQRVWQGQGVPPPTSVARGGEGVTGIGSDGARREAGGRERRGQGKDRARRRTVATCRNAWPPLLPLLVTPLPPPDPFISSSPI